MKDEAFGIIPIVQHEDGEQFLLIQHHAGHWGFPKGHADGDETAIAAACREFEEETGITAYHLLEAVSFSEQYSFERDGEQIDKTVTYFPAVVQSTVVQCQPDEIQDYAWLPFSQAQQTITFAPARQVLEEVNHYLRHRPNPSA